VDPEVAGDLLFGQLPFCAARRAIHAAGPAIARCRGGRCIAIIIVVVVATALAFQLLYAFLNIPLLLLEFLNPRLDVIKIWGTGKLDSAVE